MPASRQLEIIHAKEREVAVQKAEAIERLREATISNGDVEAIMQSATMLLASEYALQVLGGMREALVEPWHGSLEDAT